MYVEDWSQWADVSADFTGQSILDKGVPAIPEPEEVIFAGYTYENYSGDAFVLYRNGDKFYTVSGGHCSCHGLEDQWSPEEYTLEQAIEALSKYDDWGLFGQHKKQILVALEAKR